MKLKYFARHIALSVNPTKYRLVVEKTFSQTLGLYFFVWLVGLIGLFIIGLVRLESFFEALEGIVAQGVAFAEPSVLLLPGVVLLAGLLVFIASHLLTLLSAVLIKFSVGKTVSFRDGWVLCLHAVLLPLLFFMLLAPFAHLLWLFVVLFFFYVLFVAIGASLVGGKQFKSMDEKSLSSEDK